jgi:cytidylate kinase
LLITVSGLPGSGTTTAARKVAGVLGLELLPGGEVFRAMAVEHAMSLGEFGSYAAAQPTVDIELDRRLAARAAQGDVVIESRLAGWIVRNEQLDGLAVWITCGDHIRAERVAGREGIPVERALAENAEREKVEHDRYIALYGIDSHDTSIYDLVLDSGRLASDVVAERILAAAAERLR